MPDPSLPVADRTEHLSDEPTRYWFDTEFIEDGETIDLLSIGVVCEDGREFYAESTDADWSRASEWVRDNVLGYLDLDQHGMSRATLTGALLKFVNAGRSRPEFWAYYADYDWVVLCQLFGTMMDLPRGWPMFCMDVKQAAVMAGDPPLPAEPEDEHHALADARWCRDAWAVARAALPAREGAPLDHSECGNLGDHHDQEAVVGISCDPCLVPLVRALNEGGLPTVASCCGHGDQPGSVALADGRWLVLYDDADLRDEHGAIHLPEPAREGAEGRAAIRSNSQPPDLAIGNVHEVIPQLEPECSCPATISCDAHGSFTPEPAREGVVVLDRAARVRVGEAARAAWGKRWSESGLGYEDDAHAECALVLFRTFVEGLTQEGVTLRPLGSAGGDEDQGAGEL